MHSYSRALSRFNWDVLYTYLGLITPSTGVFVCERRTISWSGKVRLIWLRIGYSETYYLWSFNCLDTGWAGTGCFMDFISVLFIIVSVRTSNFQEKRHEVVTTNWYVGRLGLIIFLAYVWVEVQFIVIAKTHFFVVRYSFEFRDLMVGIVALIMDCIITDNFWGHLPMKILIKN